MFVCRLFIGGEILNREDGRMRIIELKASNVMGLSACDITPDGHLNVIGGKNGAGKSSLLNAICAALAGKGGMPSEPLKRGEKKGEIVVKIDRPDGAITVRRKLSADGKTSLVIEGVAQVVQRLPLPVGHAREQRARRLRTESLGTALLHPRRPLGHQSLERRIDVRARQAGGACHRVARARPLRQEHLVDE